MTLIQPDAPEPTSGPTPAPTTPPPAPEAPPETFDRAYVEDLRKENAKWRTALRGFEEVFDGYDDDTKAGWMDLIKIARDTPDNPELQAQLAEMLGLAVPPETPTDAPLTREDMVALARQEAQALLAQERVEREQQDGIEKVYKVAEDFGYQRGTEDGTLYLRALNMQPGPANGTPWDYEAAHQAVQAYKTAEFEKWLANKETESRQSPTILSGNGAPPSTSQTPHTFAEARESLHRRLEAAAGQ